jgi:hypothetical protein
MDQWLTDEIKEVLFTPCLTVSGNIGRRLDNRRNMLQEIDERALTEQLVDSFDTSSSENVWGNIVQLLQDQQIYLNTHVVKSTRESETGADIGLVIARSVHKRDSSSSATYAVLIQCKKIDNEGRVTDFYHEVQSSGERQSSLMLDITSSAFYFVFTPPSLVKTYCSIEPIAFSQPVPGCSSPIWNFGSFGFDSSVFPLSLLPTREKASSTGILVVPALAVEAQRKKGKSATLQDILPNSLPLWYWFGELLIPGFIGDYRDEAIAVASNVPGGKNVVKHDFTVRYSVSIRFGNG